MVLDLLLIALAITLNPLPFMAFVLVLVSARGMWKGLAFILGWLACLVAVIALVLALTGGQPPPPRSPPSTAVLVAKLVVGLSLVLYGEFRRRRLGKDRDRGKAKALAHGPAPTPSPTPAADDAPSGGSATTVRTTARPRSSYSLTARIDRGSAWAAAGLAVFLQPWALVAAGALTVVQANTSHLTTWLALFGFCLLATASLLATELYAVFASTETRTRLPRARAWLEGHEQQAIVLICLGLGLWLTGKSLYQLTS
ncbi:GAP family protein [Streptomyces sp. NPDC020742]|uniref:GAP family protein n=1 Tax=Streptomyces sp. NPDC020742 TaxID=3154897 RepID=UPI0033E283D3